MLLVDRLHIGWYMRIVFAKWLVVGVTHLQPGLSKRDLVEHSIRSWVYTAVVHTYDGE